MNTFQTIDSGKGFLKDSYENQASLWLSERLKKKKRDKESVSSS